MKYDLPERRDPYRMRERALSEGWQSVENIPGPVDGEFLVMTMSGLVRRARQIRNLPRIRLADGYGPQRVSVVGVASGNYLAAIAWKKLE